MKTLSILAFLVWSGSLCIAAEQTLPRSSPEAQGISSSAILAFVEAADKNIESMNSFMLVRHGQVVAEGWWSPYNADSPHSLYSLSKSFTSTAVGLAIAEGKLSLDDEVLKFFPEDAPSRAEQEPQGDAGQRPAAHVHGASGRAGSHAGAALDQDLPRAARAAQAGHPFPLQHVGDVHALRHRSEGDGHDRARLPKPRLFEPLGIEHPTWETSPQGITTGGYGLSIRTEDIARFGQLYLQKGEWHGKQLVPAAWVEAATARQTSNGSNPEERLGPGLRLPVLAVPPQRLPRRRSVRAILHRDARAGCRHRHHQRREGHAVRPQSGLGQAPSGHERRLPWPPMTMPARSSNTRWRV